MFKSPQVKRSLISSILNSELSHELTNHLGLTVLGNGKKISKLGGDTGYHPVFPPKFDFWQ